LNTNARGKRGGGRAEPDNGFTDRVVGVIRAIEPGDVWTYGEVAEAAGRPGAARAVGRVLATVDDELPWWRVVTAAGRLVPGHEQAHARHLRTEGVAVVDGTRGPRVSRSATR
jgi:methylated-DNA-protein-cysteine methyltransferase-like protein